jgi:8-oxo-dGTP diphosphatase
MTDASSGSREHVAVGLIVAGDGRLLLQHRDANPEISGANLWGFFGGHVEPGESVTAAFLREMDEELGWRPGHFEHYLTRDVDEREGDKGYGWHVTSHIFAAHLDVPLEQLTLGEGQALALYAPGALPEAIVPGLVDIIAEFATSDAYKRVRREWDMASTTALLVDARGRFLLQLRDEKPEIMHPGLWGSFGGRVEPYETPEDGFLREMDEELGWRPSACELYMSAPFRTLDDHDTRRQLNYVYTAALDVPLDALVLGEGAGMDAFAPDALPASIVPELGALIQRFATTNEYRELMRRGSA